jgi:hypothetical protein
MLEKQVNRAEEIIKRLNQMARADEAQSGPGVSESELSAWYNSVYDTLCDQFGKDSEQFKRFEDANYDANQAKRMYINAHINTDEVNSSAQGYVQYLNTMIVYLEGVRFDQNSQSAPEPHPSPQSLTHAFLRAVSCLPRPYGIIILIVAIAMTVLFAIWSSLPDGSKEAVLAHFWKSSI